MQAVGRRSERRLAVRLAADRARLQHDRDVPRGDPEVAGEDLPERATADRPAPPELLGREPSRPGPFRVVQPAPEPVVQRGSVGEAQAPHVQLVRGKAIDGGSRHSGG
jgi:hypothetical protein